MKELYINGLLFDIDDTTAQSMTFQFKSFLFTSINSLSSNRTWTVSLPKTERNKQNIKQCQTSDSSDIYPYRNWAVNYYSEGFRIVNDGKAILTNITDTINFMFTFGKIFDIIKLLADKKLTELTQLTTDNLAWNRSINYNDMSAGFGWCDWYNFTNEDRSYVAGTGNLDVPYAVTHPTVTLKWLINKIGTQFGIDLTELGNLSVMAKYGFPLTSAEGNSSISFYRQNTAVLSSSTSVTNGTELVFTSATLTYFTALFGAFFVPLYDAKEIYINNIDVTLLKDVDKLSSEYTVSIYVKDVDSVARKVADVPFNAAGSVGVNYLYKATNITFPFTYGVDSYFYIVITCPLSFAVCMSANLYIKRDNDSTFYSFGSTGGFFPIIPNLPDMTCSDFLYQAMQLVGVFPFIDGDDNNIIRFKSAQTIYDNLPNALNWSKKLVKSTDTESELEDVSFTFGDYTKKNILDYKENENNTLNTSGTLTVDNQNIESESKLVDLKFAAGKRFSTTDTIIDYPLYDIKINGTTLIRNAKDQGDYVLAEIVNNGSINQLRFTNALKFSSIVGTSNYISYQKLINKPRYTKEKFYLKAEDINNLDLRIPIYLEQYGKYYAIMVAQCNEEDTSDVELLEIKQI